MPADPSHEAVSDIEDIVSAHDVGIADRAGSKSSIIPRVRPSRQRNGSGKTEVSVCEEAEGDSYIPGKMGYTFVKQYCTTRTGAPPYTCVMCNDSMFVDPL